MTALVFGVGLLTGLLAGLLTTGRPDRDPIDALITATQTTTDT